MKVFKMIKNFLIKKIANNILMLMFYAHFLEKNSFTINLVIKT